ncbi:extracellular solute-binding protein [Ectobacillus sp. SYSU M60031]|uniref:Extracellular solute-binding protein n=1 Tax=Ectobacillus ponti TaxID=2961894 RepID=A0AA41XAV0_9BACI|nr:extracellular solute-binding protein [Ectobacillus ponti]MCP8969458.1 extracellular solute-binding protein [Ectobacillus ponti]
MKLIKKIAPFALAAPLVLTGCGGNNDTKKDEGTANKDTAKSGTVKLIYARGKDTTNATKKIVEEFNKKHPNIQVEFREMPSDSGKQHDAYVTALNAQSSEIDVMDLDVVWPAEFAQAGYVLPLDNFIQKDNVDMAKYNKGAVAAASFNGKQWAMPKFIDAGMLYYRKDLVPDGKVPKTWDELIATAKATKGQGGTKFGYLMQAKQYEGLVCNAVEFIAAYGGKVIDENGNVAVNSPEAIKGIKKLVEVAKSDFVPDNNNTFTEIESHTAFLEGQGVMIRNWPYMWSMVQDQAQSKVVDKVGVAPLPAGDKGSAATLGGWMSAINKYSKHKQEAWEFVKFMNGAEGQKISAIEGGLAPTLTDLFNDQDILKKNPFFKEQGFVNALSAAVPRPVTPIYPKVSEIMQINLSKAIAGQMTAEQAAAEMEKQLKDALKK